MPAAASTAPHWSQASTPWKALPQARWTMLTAGPRSEPSQRSDHAIAVAITGKKASPLPVSRYSAQSGRGARCTCSRMPCAHSELSRSDSRPGGTASSDWKSVNRRTPRNAAPTRADDQRLPKTAIVSG